jgi:hypothetical protein
MAKLNTATSLLFHIAARSPLLAREFGVQPISTCRDIEEPRLQFEDRRREFIVTEEGSEVGSETLRFDADIFARRLDGCSSGERAMYLFILNVWNSGYAKEKGWHFDLFKALDSLDSENTAMIAWFLERPVWP